MLEKRIKLGNQFGSEYEGEYLFLTIGWAMYNRLSAECTKVIPELQIADVNLKELNAKIMMATLIKKPKIITLAHLVDESEKGLPPALGEILMAATDYVNGYSPKQREEVKNLKEQFGLI